MFVRRMMMLATLAGVLAPFIGVRAQPGPGPERDMPQHDMNHDDHHDNEHERPRMPEPRHEERPHRPEGEGWRWREGHWSWNGREWAWLRGRWFH